MFRTVTAALWLLRWLCTVVYQPSRHGRWRVRLAPALAGSPPAVPLDCAAAWLLRCLCLFLLPAGPGQVTGGVLVLAGSPHDFGGQAAGRGGVAL